MSYVCNHVRLNLEETGFGSDVPNEVLQADVAKTSYAGYVAPDFTAAAPAQAQAGGSGGTGGQPAGQGTAPAANGPSA